MARRVLDNSDDDNDQAYSQPASQSSRKRQKVVEEDTRDEEQMSYDQEIRDSAQHLGAEVMERAVLPVCADGYRPGSLLHIRMTNVMSYDQCEFHFGPKLNFVIGPNGSGKSTILAAICLVFAAPIKCMGKESLTALQLIKSGRSFLEVEVVVKNYENRPNMTFFRHLKAGSKTGSSVFKIDGHDATIKQVRAAARTLDIQVSSMTRFLPQDRIKDFTTMSPKQLLLTTMEDVGYANMKVHYEWLVDKQENGADDEQRLRLAQKTLADLEVRRLDLQDKIEKLEEHEQKEERLEKLKQVKAYAETRAKEALMNRRKDEARQAKGVVDDLKAQEQQCKEQRQIVAAERKKADHALNRVAEEGAEIGKATKKAKSREEEARSQLDHLDGKLLAAKDNLARHETMEAKLKAELDKAEADCAKREEIVNSPDYAEKTQQLKDAKRALDVKLEAKNAELLQRGQRRRELDKKRDAKQHEVNQEKSKQDALGRQNVIRVNVDTIRQLQRYAPPDTYRYSLPAINNVRLKNAQDQTMVNCVVRGAARAFVAKDKESLKAIIKAPVALDAREVTETLDQASRNTPMSREELTRLGLDGYILDLIEGPDHNLAHLCVTSQVHRIPYSHKPLTPENHNRVASKVTKFVAGGIMYTVKKSRYGQKSTSTKSELLSGYSSDKRNSIIYEKVPDLRKQHQLEEELDQVDAESRQANLEYKAVQTEHNAISHDRTEAGTEVSNHEKMAKVLEVRQRSLQEQKAKLEQLVSNRPKSLDEVRASISNQKAMLLEAVQKTILVRVESAKKAVSLMQRAQLAEIVDGRLSTRLASVDEAICTLAEETTTAFENFKKLRNLYNEAKQEYKELRGDQLNLGPEYKDFFDALSEQFPDTEDLHQNVQAELEKIEQDLTYDAVDKNARELIKGVIEQEEVKRQEVERLQRERSQLSEEIKRTSDVFVPRLEEIVQKISSKFAILLADKKGAAGRVNLRKFVIGDDDQEKDELLPFSQWGIDILCRFRPTGSYVRLNSTTQSGGERSMAIGTYLLSLQAAAPVAFRALDEINQALDATNEVIMNQHVADIACKSNQQLFLLSPKLIRFNYPRGTRVHVILNGAGVDINGKSGGDYTSITHTRATLTA